MSTTPYPVKSSALGVQALPTHRKYFFMIAFAILILDQFTKWLIVHNLALHETVKVLPGLFQLIHVENQGAAFGLFADSPSAWRIGGLIVFSLVALVVVSVLLWKNGHKFSYGGVALSLILGGALGNLWDRIFQGHVVDFFDFYIGNSHWPAFNIADSAIVIGAFLLIGEILFQAPAHS
jgi:signal peptidase II